MFQLNLPAYQFRIKQDKKSNLILDTFRKRYVKLTPEEWVRQNFLEFLAQEKGFSKALMAVETQLTVNTMKKRCDAVFYDIQGNPSIILEFKAPNVEITQSVFDQVAVYNSKLNVKYFIVSNGMVHYFCRVNTENAQYEFFNGIPSYEEFYTLIS
ncbi:conserved hypothetical protein [uncultured Paludibacter sp.]|nr:conserved hypothetical protein [uncultured Paludibacter sp.]